MSTLAIPYTAELAAGIAAVIAHASKDAVTPILCGARFDRRYVVATDRYTVGRYEHTTHPESVARYGEEGPTDPDAGWWIPTDALVWLSKQAATLKHAIRSGLLLVISADTLTIHYGESETGTIAASLHYTADGGNFPPVARLFPEKSDDAIDGFPPAWLGVDSFTKLSKSGTAIGRAEKKKNIPIRFQFQAGEGRKLAPVLAHIGDRFDSLIQPVMPSTR